MEHNGKVLGESLDLIKYVDANFEGTPLFPNVSKKCTFILFLSIILRAKNEAQFSLYKLILYMLNLNFRVSKNVAI